MQFFSRMGIGITYLQPQRKIALSFLFLRNLFMAAV